MNRRNSHVNSVFLFAPDGPVHCCLVNAPGSMHPSSLADFRVHEKMSQVCNKHQAKVVVDLAFNQSGSPFLITSSQEVDPVKTAANLSLSCKANLFTQLAEWGMRMIQAQFPRMKEPIACRETGKRRLLQHLMVLLHNFQTSTVSIDQTLDACMS